MSIIFGDEEKLNLDRRDGFQYFWHDLRTEYQMFLKRVQGYQSIMVSGAVACKGPLFLAGIEGSLNSTYYCTVLEDAFFEKAEDLYGKNRTL